MHIDKKKQSQLKIILFFWSYLFSQKQGMIYRYFFAAFFVILTILLNILTPISFKYLIDIMTNKQVAFTWNIIIILLSFGTLWTLARIVSQCRQIFMFRIFERCVRLFGYRLFEHLSILSMRYHKNRKTGSIINSMDRAQAAIPTVFWTLLFLIIPTITEIIIAAIILWYLYGVFYGVELLLTLVIFIVFTMSATQKAVLVQRKCNEKNKAVSSYFTDRLLNYETLQYLQVDKNHELNRCDQLLKEREDAMTHQLISMNLVGVGQSVILGIGMIIATFMSAKSVILGYGLKVSDYVLISSYLIQFSVPLSLFGFIFRQMRQGLTDLENVMEIINEKQEIIDSSEAINLDCKQVNVIFENVTFAYKTSKYILNDLSFSIPENQMVAIVGPTGCGKSTIARLLFRFYDLNEGCIKINGRNIKNYSLSSLRSIISVVPQNVVLFNGSIYFNITYSNPNVDKKRVHEIIEMMELDHFIDSLPQGYDTVVGERGLKLSGGERQRIGIARALIKSPKLFIFDEATSSLDMRTESIIQRNLAEISRNVTTLIIAHRLSTVAHADTIIVLDDKATIVESGQHQMLLAREGFYTQMWRYQSQPLYGKGC